MKLYDNLADVLCDGGRKDRSIRFIEADKDETVITVATLWQRAICMLGTLQERGMAPGDELVVFTRSNEKFVVAFWAAILGGIVPVPVAVGISDDHRLKLFRILRQLERGTLFTEPELQQRLIEFARDNNAHDVLETLDGAAFPEDEEATEGQVIRRAPDDTAFIQYSSGSTREPKGVCLSHRNLGANIRAIVEGAGWNERDSSLSWMPLTHDMGLIGYHLSVMAAGMNHSVMDTGLFVRRPLLWMSKASEHAATQLCSPNFGYKHFLKMFERKGMDTLDLSAVRLILNGAEPISAELCEEFLAALAPYGLKRSTLFPVYGLAEATVAVSFPVPGTDYSCIVANRHSLRIGAPYETAEHCDDDAVRFVKVGSAVRDCRIRVTDEADAPLPDGHVGHIQIAGTNVTGGLYGADGAEAGLFTSDGWLRTGDCGVFVDHELAITGRSKDIVIVNGQNYYPHDLEEIIARVDDLDLGKVVVCSAARGTNPTEELLVFLLYRRDLDQFPALADAVRTTLGARTGLEIDRIIPVARIPKTTSGKVQRAQLAAAYADGEFDGTLEALAATSTESTPDHGEANGSIVDLLTICRKYAKDRLIGPDDNLFEVGVSSLTLTEIVLAIDEKYPGQMDIGNLFDYPTVREIADFLQHRLQDRQ